VNIFLNKLQIEKSLIRDKGNNNDFE